VTSARAWAFTADKNAGHDANLASPTPATRTVGGFAGAVVLVVVVSGADVGGERSSEILLFVRLPHAASTVPVSTTAKTAA